MSNSTSNDQCGVSKKYVKFSQGSAWISLLFSTASFFGCVVFIIIAPESSISCQFFIITMIACSTFLYLTTFLCSLLIIMGMSSTPNRSRSSDSSELESRTSLYQTGTLDASNNPTQSMNLVHMEMPEKKQKTPPPPYDETSLNCLPPLDMCSENSQSRERSRSQRSTKWGPKSVTSSVRRQHVTSSTAEAGPQVPNVAYQSDAYIPTECLFSDRQFAHEQDSFQESVNQIYYTKADVHSSECDNGLSKKSPGPQVQKLENRDRTSPTLQRISDSSMSNRRYIPHGANVNKISSSGAVRKTSNEVHQIQNNERVRESPIMARRRDNFNDSPTMPQGSADFTAASTSKPLVQCSCCAEPIADPKELPGRSQNQPDMLKRISIPVAKPEPIQRWETRNLAKSQTNLSGDNSLPKMDQASRRLTRSDNFESRDLESSDTTSSIASTSSRQDSQQQRQVARGSPICADSSANADFYYVQKSSSGRMRRKVSNATIERIRNLKRRGKEALVENIGGDKELTPQEWLLAWNLSTEGKSTAETCRILGVRV